MENKEDCSYLYSIVTSNITRKSHILTVSNLHGKLGQLCKLPINQIRLQFRNRNAARINQSFSAQIIALDKEQS
jgi:hypothetical protein